MIKFIYRFLFHLAITICISLPLQLLSAIILLPFIPFYEIGSLPRYLRWFDNADSYLPNRPRWTNDLINKGGWITDPLTVEGTYSGYQLILNRYIWLVWRNPINYFSYTILGIPFTDIKIIQNKVYPNIPVHEPVFNIGDTEGEYPGLQISEVLINNKSYYEYYFCYPYKLFSKQYCIRIRMGYKLTEALLVSNGYIEEVFTISPFHTYYGNL